MNLSIIQDLRDTLLALEPQLRGQGNQVAAMESFAVLHPGAVEALAECRRHIKNWKSNLDSTSNARVWLEEAYMIIGAISRFWWMRGFTKVAQSVWIDGFADVFPRIEDGTLLVSPIAIAQFAYGAGKYDSTPLHL
jgi:hypothetical protein